uniref:Cadherin domain-containing protein n=1 Tax=Globodera rostochiensis TaxID=31243 RepID=A0A914GVZ7_GLORO
MLLATIFTLFSLFLTALNGAGSTDRRLLRLFSARGTLDRAATAGTFVQFDGPMRVSAQILQNSTVSVTVAEPFFLRQFFRVVPTIPTAMPSSRPLDASEIPVQNWESGFLNLTLLAQIVPPPQRENASQYSVLELEEKQIVVQLVQKFRPNLRDESHFPVIAPQAVRDPNNCSIFRAKVQNWPEKLFAAHLIGPSADHFTLIMPSGANASETQKSGDNFLILHHQNAKINEKCAPTVSLSFLLYIDLAETYGTRNSVLHPLELFTENSNASASGNVAAATAQNAPHFTRTHFCVQYNATARAFTTHAEAPLVLLAHVHPSRIARANDGNKTVEFALVQSESAGLIEVEPSTGTIVPRDADALSAALRRRHSPLTITATLRKHRGGPVADKADIQIELAPENRTSEANNFGNKVHAEDPEVRFEKPIYAFAIDPFLNKITPGGIAVGTIDVTQTARNGTHFVVAEGGAGHFAFGDNSNLLLYTGAIGQFSRDFALKVLLRQRGDPNDRVDTAIVHALVAGTDSQPAHFPLAFRRVLQARVPAAAADVALALPAARDPDANARLSYAIDATSSACRDRFGLHMRADDCTRAFSVSQTPQDGDAYTVRIDRTAAQTMSEAVLNISAHDDAHPVEPNDYAVLLIKFVAENDSSVETGSSVSEPFTLRRAIAGSNFPERITLNDSFPANALVQTFGLALPRPPALNFSLFTNFRHFAIGKDSGHLFTTRQLRGLAGKFQLRVQVQYGHEVESIPFQLEVTKSPKFGENLEFSNKLDPIGDDIDQNEIRPGMELGRLGPGCLNSSTKFELLPNEFVSTQILQINANNGAITLGDGFFRASDVSNRNFTRIFRPDHPVELFVRASNCDRVVHVPVHFWLPNWETTGNSRQMPLPSSPPLPKSPLALPETIPAGSFLCSLDFAVAPRLDHFRLQTVPNFDATNGSTVPILALERRANSIVVRTARPLKGISDGPIDVRILHKNNDTEIGHFSIRLESAAPCQPRFKRSQPLRFTVEQDVLRQLPDDAPWLPAGALSAEFADSAARNCSPLQFSLRRAGDDADQQQQLEALIRVEPTTGLLSVHARAAAAAADGRDERQIMLLVEVRSGAFQARHGIQLLIRRPKQPPVPLRFAGVLVPLQLDIDEGVPAGSSLTTVRAVPSGGVRYRLEANDQVKALVEVNARSGELRTLHALDFEALSMNRNLIQNLAILNFSVKAESEGGGQGAELNVQLRIHDVNDNAPVFDQSVYDFVLERNAPVGTVVGQVIARDADASAESAPSIRLLSCHFLNERVTRPIRPPELAFALDAVASGKILLRTPVDSSPGALFRLELGAEDGEDEDVERRQRNQHNATVNVWVCDEPDIVSVLIARSPVELDATALSAFLTALSARTRPARAVLHALRYRPGMRGVPGELQANAAVLQVCFVNGTRIVPFDALERTLRNADGVEGMDGFEQNLFMASVDEPRRVGPEFLGGPSSAPAVAHPTGSQLLLSLTLIFGALLCAVCTTIGVLLCQHRQRFQAEKRLAHAADTIRDASAHADSCADNHSVNNGIGNPSAHFVVPGAFPSPPPAHSMPFMPQKYAEIWKRPLPPAPPLSSDGIYQSAQPSTDYYAVQEMKLNL